MGFMVFKSTGLESVFKNMHRLPRYRPKFVKFWWFGLAGQFWTLFWKDDSHTLLGANYGSGKTSLLVSCSLSSEDDDGDVTFISAASYGPEYECTYSVRYVLDLATALEFENTYFEST